MLMSNLGPHARRGISVTSLCLAFAAWSGAAGAGPTAVGSPLRPAAIQPLGPHFTVLSTDASAVNAMPAHGEFVVRAFPLSSGLAVDLSLSAFDVFAPEARIVLASPAGEVSLPRPSVRLFHGSVAGHEGSTAFLSLSDEAVHGLVQLDGATFVISSGPAGAGQAPIVYNADDAEERIGFGPYTCQTDQADLRTDSMKMFESTYVPGDFGNRAGPCREAFIAVETDQEFLSGLFGGNQTNATNYVATLFGAMTDIYKRDVNTKMTVNFLRLWTTTDPWNQGNTVDQLYQFQDYWNTNMTGQSRTVAHFLSGRGLGGGVAWVGALCEPDFDYALSANLSGFFPYPLVNNHSQNWDPFVVSHELGHNFGTFHTHDLSQYNPRIDNCAGGDCSQSNLGTIMSYCHTCPGGMSNIRLEFHPRTIDVILAYLDTRPACVPVIDCADCPADFNGDGFVTGDDFDQYVAAFENGDASADFNNDGFVTGDDFDAFVVAFEAGCG